MVQNGIFWTIGENLYFIYYPIISYQLINVYRVEIMDSSKISLTRWRQWNMQIHKFNSIIYYSIYRTGWCTLVGFLL